MGTAAKGKAYRRPKGRPTSLTPKVHRALVEAVRKGAPIELAADAVGLSRVVVKEWLRRGRGDDPYRPCKEPYASFARDIDMARPALRLHCLDTVNTVVQGQECRACGGVGETTTETDRGERIVKCPACSGSGWQLKPDGRLAMTVLERQVPEFARRDQIEHTHHVSGEIGVEHRLASSVDGLPLMDVLDVLERIVEAPALETRDVLDAEEE